MVWEKAEGDGTHMPGDIQTSKGIRRKILEAAIIYGLATLLASGLWGIRMRAENIIMIYLISVIVMMIEVRGFVWGCAYTVLCILTFNFLFTEPRFTLRVNDPNYVVTMGIFMAVSAITGLLVSRLGEQVRIARENGNRMEALLEISGGYLTLSGLENIVYYGIKSLYQAAGERCIVYVAASQGELGKTYYVKNHFSEPGILDNDTPAHWCYINHTACGAGTGFYGDSGWVYLPIRNRDVCLGVIGVYTNGHEIDESHMVFINTVMSQMAMAIEKEKTQDGRPSAPKNTDGSLPEGVARSLYQDFCLPFEHILDETEHLLAKETEDNSGEFPGILLKLRTLGNRTKNMFTACLMEYAGGKADKKNENFAAIAEQAIKSYAHAGGDRIIWIKKPDKPVMVHADAAMIEQAVSNLLDNALIHTPGQEKIYVSLGQEHGYGILEIADCGSGISFQELLEKMRGTQTNGREPAGIGLSVSKEIIDANGGNLIIKSSRYGGTAVSLSLPIVQG